MFCQSNVFKGSCQIPTQPTYCTTGFYWQMLMSWIVLLLIHEVQAPSGNHVNKFYLKYLQQTTQTTWTIFAEIICDRNYL